MYTNTNYIPFYGWRHASMTSCAIAAAHRPSFAMQCWRHERMYWVVVLAQWRRWAAVWHRFAAPCRCHQLAVCRRWRPAVALWARRQWRWRWAWWRWAWSPESWAVSAASSARRSDCPAACSSRSSPRTANTPQNTWRQHIAKIKCLTPSYFLQA